MCRRGEIGRPACRQAGAHARELSALFFLRHHRIFAQVAKLVDAHASEACGSNPLEVRVFSWAPFDSQFVRELLTHGKPRVLLLLLPQPDHVPPPDARKNGSAQKPPDHSRSWHFREEKISRASERKQFTPLLPPSKTRR